VTQPKTNEPLNNTYTSHNTPGVHPKDKNILIQMIDQKKVTKTSNQWVWDDYQEVK